MSILIICCWLALSLRRIDFIGRLTNFAAVFQLCAASLGKSTLLCCPHISSTPPPPPPPLSTLRIASAVMIVVLLATAEHYAPWDFLLRARSSAQEVSSSSTSASGAQGGQPVLMTLMAVMFSLFSFSGYDSGSQARRPPRILLASHAALIELNSFFRSPIICCCAHTHYSSAPGSPHSLSLCLFRPRPDRE